MAATASMLRMKRFMVDSVLVEFLETWNGVAYKLLSVDGLQLLLPKLKKSDAVFELTTDGR